MKKWFPALLLLLSCTTAFAQHVCGTAQIFRNLLEQKGSSTKKLDSKTHLALTSSEACTIEDYYDEILTQASDHFQIFYTLDGPHKTTQAFIDSLSKHLEYAWNFHVKNSGMKPPLGISKTHHYQQDVIPGLYPVEVIEIDLIRNARDLFNEKFSEHPEKQCQHRLCSLQRQGMFLRRSYTRINESSTRLHLLHRMEPRASHYGRTRALSCHSASVH